MRKLFCKRRSANLCVVMVCVLIFLTVTGCTSKNKEDYSQDSDSNYSYSTKDGNNENTGVAGNTENVGKAENEFDAENKNDTGNYIVNDETINIESTVLEKNKVLADYDFAEDDQWIFPPYTGNEAYNEYRENPFVSSKNNPLSTFSIDVDTASYSNIRRMITNGEGVEKDAVRIEEMINYFDYNYNEPSGKDPFSIYTEVSYTRWNPDSKLLLIGIQGKDITKEIRPKNNLVFLIDVSGSMDDYDKLPLVKTALNMLTEELTEDDRISIVTYSGEEKVVLKGARGNEKSKIKDAINELNAAGSTAGEAGITKAYEIARKYFIEDGNNRILLATDGDLNVGISNEDELTKFIEEKRETGISLSVLGVGTGNYKDNNLEALADNGNGNYSYIDSELEAKKVLVDELQGTLYTIAKDVKIQVEFNPKMVKGYRLIGYDNRIMNSEDFDDDKKDAGEIGAGQSVTAMYEIVLTNSEMDIPETDLIYEGKNDVNSTDWLTIKVRYKEPTGDESKLIMGSINSDLYDHGMSKKLALASSVAAFGMILKDSEYKGSATYDMVLEMLDQYKNSFDEYKTEFVKLVKMMKDNQ